MLEKVRNGEIRVLLGSTQKMGAGTNVQTKLIALHDLDVPWRPSDLEQRAGRIVRQGNENKKVEVYRYITENTFDAYLWQTIENKQKFISQIMTSKTPIRTAEDVDESTLNYAEIKALATGNPLIKEKMDLDLEVSKLSILEANYKSNLYQMEDKIINYFPKEIKEKEEIINNIKSDIENIKPLPNNEDKFSKIVINNKEIMDKKTATKELLSAITSIKNTDIPEKIGEYRNFEIYSYYNSTFNEYRGIVKGQHSYHLTFGGSASGNLSRIDNLIDNKILELSEKMKEDLNNLKNNFENAKEEVKKPFLQKEILKEKKVRLNELNKLLDIGNNNTINSKETLDKEELKNLVKETIKKEIPKDNYNVLTGNPIIAENHSSGDKRWIAMADIKDNNISIKDNQNSTLTIVLYDENGKLHASPIEYYNVSQLEISKELEQKFVPMKEKDKNVEKSKDRGIER